MHQTGFRYNNSRCISEASVHSTHKNESRKPYQINTLSTLGMRAIGKWRNAALKLCAVLNQGKTVSKIAWAKYTKRLVETSSEVTDSNMEMNAKEAHSTSYNNGDVKSTCVSFDCTWNSCGWQAKEGVAADIALKTSKITDIVRKTTYYREYKKV